MIHRVLLRYALILTACALIMPACKKEQAPSPPVTPVDTTGNIDLPGQWESIKQMPEAVTEMCATEMNGKLYIFGGVTVTDTSNRIYCYDPQSNEWHVAGTLPVRVHHNATAAVGGTLYMIGGLVGDQATGGHTIANVYAFHALSGNTSEVSPLPKPLAGGTAESLDGKIYFFGGTTAFGTGNYNSIIYAFHPDSSEWFSAGTFARPREHIDATSYGGRILIAGGRKHMGEAGFFTMEAVDAWDPLTKEWEFLPDLPESTSASSVSVLGGKLYVIGGEQLNGYLPSGFRLMKKTFELNLEAGTWQEMEPLPTSRHGTNAVTIGSCIYVAGGGTVAFQYAASAGGYRFNPTLP